jgi:putative NADH-flavin reductase
MNPSQTDDNPKKTPQIGQRDGVGRTRDPRRVMKLAVLGATGSVGRELVTQALAAGHEVTALVREHPKPGEIDDRVALVLGDATSAEAVKRTVDRSDAVVSALGHAKGAPDDLLAHAGSNIIAAMRADGVERLVVLSSPAVADAADRPSLFYRAALVLMRVVIRSIVRDHREQARLIEESGLAWTIVRGPIVFTDGPRTGRYHAGPIGRDSGLRISRADLAEFMLATSTDGGFMRMKPLVSQ